MEKEKTLALLNEYLNFGGYPRVVLEREAGEKVRIINEIFRSYVEKYIAYFLGVNRTDAFSLLVKLLADQTGQIIRYSKLAAECGISVATLKNYIWYAEKTFIVKIITPYFKNKRKEITKSPSVYFCDLINNNSRFQKSLSRPDFDRSGLSTIAVSFDLCYILTVDCFLLFS